MTRHTSLQAIALTTLLTGGLTTIATADEDLFDCWIQVDATGRVVTGSITEGTPGDPIDTNVRIFPTEVGEDPEFPFSAFEPGYQVLAAPDFAGATWTFTNTQPLKKWNGSGFDVSAETLTMSFGPGTSTTGAGPTPGFGFGGFASGLLHDHFDFTLLPGAGATEPTDGLYLWTHTLEGTNGSLTFLPSLEVFFLFNLNQTDATLDAAIDFIQDTLDGCPGDIAAPEGVVDSNDILAVINQWNCTAPDPCTADIAEPVGVVDSNDLLAVINSWGTCPSP